MARKPNYGQQRAEVNRAKQAKKEAKRQPVPHGGGQLFIERRRAFGRGSVPVPALAALN